MYIAIYSFVPKWSDAKQIRKNLFNGEPLTATKYKAKRETNVKQIVINTKTKKIKSNSNHLLPIPNTSCNDPPNVPEYKQTDQPSNRSVRLVVDVLVEAY